LHEMLFADRTHTRELITEIFCELIDLACASQRDRFQDYNPNENDDTIILSIMDQNEENDLLRITKNTDAFTCEVMGNA
ncbi:SPI-2 type III secretion system effector SifA, partial [Salmonella enterica subsp. enterica serovar Infantis]